MSDYRRAWHFVRLRDGKPYLRDGRPMPEIGEWLIHEGGAVICESGLHASWQPLDALSYCEWRDAAVCLVEVDDVVAEQSDKFVCKKRRVLAWAPVDDLFRLFARECALSVLHLWSPPKVVVDYLNTGDETLRAAAWDAAGDAAGDAARAAASAARDAAWAAARDAADAAGEDAAWAVAWAAARDAAWAAARDAAWAAARAAAWASRAAARAAQNELLESLLLCHLNAHDLCEE